MSTTDRMPNLNSLRSDTDRFGEPLVLGNARLSADLSITASVVAAAFGVAEAKVPANINVVSTLGFFNGSFGLWSVYLNITASAVYATKGAAIASAAMTSTSAASLAIEAGDDEVIGEIKLFAGTSVPF